MHGCNVVVRLGRLINFLLNIIYGKGFDIVTSWKVMAVNSLKSCYQLSVSFISITLDDITKKC